MSALAKHVHTKDALYLVFLAELFVRILGVVGLDTPHIGEKLNSIPYLPGSFVGSFFGVCLGTCLSRDTQMRMSKNVLSLFAVFVGKEVGVVLEKVTRSAAPLPRLFGIDFGVCGCRRYSKVQVRGPGVLSVVVLPICIGRDQDRVRNECRGKCSNHIVPRRCMLLAFLESQ